MTTATATWTVRWPTICSKCDTVMGVGELAYAGGPTVRHANCPRYAKTCTECNLQHTGECL